MYISFSRGTFGSPYKLVIETSCIPELVQNARPSVARLGTEKTGEGGSELRRFEVQLQPRPGAVTEEELEEALEAAAEGVEDISEHWEDAMAAVRRTEALFPLYKHTEEDSLRIRATQASGEQRNIIFGFFPISTRISSIGLKVNGQ